MPLQVAKRCYEPCDLPTVRRRQRGSAAAAVLQAAATPATAPAAAAGTASAPGASTVAPLMATAAVQPAAAAVTAAVQLPAAAGEPAAAAVATAARLPEQWSRDETMIRTGAFGQLSGTTLWQPTPLGGSDVVRPLRNYAANKVSFGTVQSCTKHKASHQNLLPGCMVFWCMKCRTCRHFSVMHQAESPRHPFEVLYTRCPEAPGRFCFDNGCNVHAYMLNREAAFFKRTRVAVDESHFRGHKNCAPDYNTGRPFGSHNAALCFAYNKDISIIHRV